MCFLNNTEGGLSGTGRQRRGARPSPLLTLTGLRDVSGPWKYLFTMAGPLGLRSLSFLMRLVATVLAPVPPRGLEGPPGTWLPAKSYPLASAPSPASLVPHQSVFMSVAPRAWMFQASPEWPCCPPADPASQAPEPRQANPHSSASPAWHPGALALRTRRFWAHHPHAPLATFAHREVGSEGALGPLLAGQAVSPPMPGAPCPPQQPRGKECSVFHGPGSCSRQAHKPTGLQGLGLCIVPCV